MKDKRKSIVTLLLILITIIFLYWPLAVRAEKYVQTVTIDSRPVHINIPDNVSDASPVIVYFHGMVDLNKDGRPDNTFVDNVQVITTEIMELRSAGQPVVLIAPNGEGGENGCWRNMNSSWLNKAIAKAKTESGKQLNKIILAGHSCGNGGIKNAIGASGVYKVILLDGMYGSFSTIAKNYIFASISTNHSTVATNTAALYKEYFSGELKWNNQKYETNDKRVAIYTTNTISHMDTRKSLSDLYLIKTEAVPQSPPKKLATVAELEGSGNKKTNPLLSVQIPSLGAFSPLKCTVSSGNTGSCKVSWIGEYISALYSYGTIVVAVLAVIMLQVGGWRWIFAAGNTEQISSAKRIIGSAVIGLILMLTSYLLFNFINPALLGGGSIELDKNFFTEEEMKKALESLATTPADDTDIVRDPIVQPTGSPIKIPDLAAYKNVCAKYSPRLKTAPHPAYVSDSQKTVASECNALGSSAPVSIKMVDAGSTASIKVINKAKGVCYLTLDVASALKNALDCIGQKMGAEHRNNFYVASANCCWRSASAQYSTYNSPGSNAAAAPCCSNHGYGIAIDIWNNKAPNCNGVGNDPKCTSYADTNYKECMNKNGLKRLPSEYWHWSPTGG